MTALGPCFTGFGPSPCGVGVGFIFLVNGKHNKAIYRIRFSRQIYDSFVEFLNDMRSREIA